MPRWETSGNRKLPISSFEKQESSDDDSERRLLLSWADPAQDEGVESLKPNQTFQTFGNASYYKPIEGYEGAHRYDPKLEWEPKEEKKLVRKVCSLGNTSSIDCEPWY